MKNLNLHMVVENIENLYYLASHLAKHSEAIKEAEGEAYLERLEGAIDSFVETLEELEYRLEEHLLDDDDEVA